MILLGMGFDFADGLAARWLKAHSEIGKQLDSLADMVTFGVLPSLLLFNLIAHDTAYLPFAYLSFVYAVSVAWRLARFNTYQTNKSYFVGLPSPAAAFVVAGIAYQPDMLLWSHYFDKLSVAVCFTITLSALMVANIPLLSLKFKDLAWRENKLRYVLIGVAAVLGAFYQLAAVLPIIFIYVCLSWLFREKIINQ